MNEEGFQDSLAYSGIQTFLKSSYVAPDELTKADVAFTGVPYDNAVSNDGGAKHGPKAIREASGWWGYLAGYKGVMENLQTGSTVDYGKMELVDCGDSTVYPLDQEATVSAVTEHVEQIRRSAFPLVAGGDHSVTYPSYLGVAKGLGDRELGLIQIDAHADMVEESTFFGDQFHGSVTAQIAQSRYGDYTTIGQIGLRGYQRPGFTEEVTDRGVQLVPMREVRSRGITEVLESVLETISNRVDDIYVTFDIDSLDPSVAPGTGTPVPGGLSAQDAIDVMELLGTREEVVALDLTEVSPPLDPTSRTAKTAAHLLAVFLETRFCS